jgi:hypothetical protein
MLNGQSDDTIRHISVSTRRILGKAMAAAAGQALPITRESSRTVTKTWYSSLVRLAPN